MADAVFAVTGTVMMEADIATAAYDYQFVNTSVISLIITSSTWRRIPRCTRFGPNTPGYDAIESGDQLVRGGTERARQRCTSELSKGNYFPGCLIWSTRY